MFICYLIFVILMFPICLFLNVSSYLNCISDLARMSTFVCAISGQQPDVPVASPASGKIFEKRLLIKFIEENGTDPINGQQLDVTQLIELKSDHEMRLMQNPLGTASLPSLLKQLQDEWDATMLNNFTLRQELKAVREELTHALFQNDAACRVINRLSSELQQARQIIAALPHGRRNVESEAEITDVEMRQGDEENEPSGINDALVNFFIEKSQEFSAARKQRGKHLPDSLASVETIEKYIETKSFDALHSASQGGINALDLQKHFILTGGLDKTIVLFNIQNETIENTFKGHQKRINAVRIHPNLQTIVSGSQDCQIRIWSINETSARNVVNTLHEQAITDLSLHPTGGHILCTSDDSHWSLIDLTTGYPLTKIKSGEEDDGIRCGQFHPDGLIFGTGAKSSIVKIWDIKEQVNVAQFPGHQDEVCAISFSENGYYLATGSLDGEVKIWDLRKLKNLKTFVLNNSKQAINALTFDQYGAYLAVAGANVQIFQSKTWNKVAQFDGYSQMVTGVCFGEEAKFIVSSSLDKTVRIHSMPEQQ